MEYDKELEIAVAKSRREKKWKNKKILWSELAKRLEDVISTKETKEEYRKMAKDEQDNIKDVGGFVGGSLKEGIRKNGYVISRSMLSLDIDFGKEGLWDDIELFTDYAICCYSTHKHTKENPRLRLIIPLGRNISAEEYEAIARYVANDIGMDYFDDTTYEPTRLMFFPSKSKDADFFYKLIDKPFLDPDKILENNPNWKDSSFWPESSRSNGVRRKTVEKQGDPLEKEGLIGAFCRTYSIDDVIEKFLNSVYIKSNTDDRYTYKEGSTANGLVVYDNKFAYSNHGSDPASHMLCNAFDLVRIHMFGELDKDDTLEITKKLSYQKMIELAANDEEVKKEIIREKQKEINDDFEDNVEEEGVEVDNLDWTRDLDVDKKGNIKSTINNILVILNNDKNFKNMGGLDLFNSRYIVKKKLPWKRYASTWTDADEAGLRSYLEKVYGIEGRQKIQDAIDRFFNDHAFHPVKDYLNGLKWDGKNRLETLLIDYLGADDNLYTRTVTRKAMTAAVTRIFEPGCKYDYILTLLGKQGIGKSLIFNKLAGAWFSDTLPNITGKEAYEALDGVWVIEISELSAFRKSEIEAVKSYVSKQADIYRKAYARNTSINPRQCIFVGTTNDNEFINDMTGGRRFWIIPVNDKKRTKTVWDDLDDYEKDQIWAEAVENYKKGENINSLGNVQDEALRLQEEHSESSEMIGVVEEFLGRKIPENYYDMEAEDRIRWINATEDFKENEGKLIDRTFVSSIEIWCECFRKDKAKMTNYDAKIINGYMRKIKGWERKDGNNFRNIKGYGKQRIYEKV